MLHLANEKVRRWVGEFLVHMARACARAEKEGRQPYLLCTLLRPLVLTYTYMHGEALELTTTPTTMSVSGIGMCDGGFVGALWQGLEFRGREDLEDFEISK